MRLNLCYAFRGHGAIDSDRPTRAGGDTQLRSWGPVDSHLGHAATEWIIMIERTSRMLATQWAH